MKMIDVGKQGKYYTLNDGTGPRVVKPDDFYGIDGFKFPNHIWAWIKGGAHGEGGGVHLGRARRYIEEEVLGNGCRRMRSPVEVAFWEGPYFDLVASNPAPYTLTNVANTMELVNLNVGTGSGFSLTPGMKKMIRMYVNLAREYEIVIEIPWLWTLKSRAGGEFLRRAGLSSDPRERHAKDGRPGASIWNEHFLAAHGIGAYLHQLRTVGDGDGLSRVEPGPLNLIHDVMNEFTAHVEEIWKFEVKNGRPTGTLAEVARRWRQRDAVLEQILLISQSGDADKYDPPLQSRWGDHGYSGPCLHPPRDGMWAKTGDVMRRTWRDELIDVNESQLGLTSEQRQFWVRLIPKWAGLGSSDMGAWARMHENFVENECYTTFHNFRGMDAGWPWTEQTIVEETIRGITGGAGNGNGEPPPPETWPPADQALRPFDDEVVKAYLEILGRGNESNIDIAGRKGWNEQLEIFYDPRIPGGTSVEQMRDHFRKSKEFRGKNKGPWDFPLGDLPPVDE